MTIAIGIMTSEGPLLCTDSQFTSSSKTNRKKIFMLLKQGTALAFALSGSEDNGKMAIQECFDAIEHVPPDARTIDGIKTLVRVTMKPLFEEYVDDVPYEERETARFDVVFGVCTKAEPRGRLFSCVGGAVVEVDDFVCLGSGSYLGEYVLKPTYRAAMNWNEAVISAMRAVAAAKGYDAACGGQTQFAAFRNGRTAFIPHKVEETERQIGRFETLSAEVLLALANPELDDDSFNRALDQYRNGCMDLRDKILKEGSEVRQLDQWFAEKFKSGPAATE